MPVYHKLVRDRIPEIIRENGNSCRTRILTDEEYRVELGKKLREESDEVITAHTSEEALEELADVLEVLQAYAAAHGAAWEQVEELRRKKAAARGGFRERIYLIDTVGED